MMLHEITSSAGAHKRRKRVGRGQSSGHGKTSTRGNKGCQARSGGGTRPLHEGGQMPLFRRIPKRGFSNFNFRTEYEVVNVGTLNERFDNGETVDAESLRKHRLIARGGPLKILGDGALSKKLSVVCDAISSAARAAIEKAGGTVSLVERIDAADKWRAKRKKGVSSAARKSAKSAKVRS